MGLWDAILGLFKGSPAQKPGAPGVQSIEFKFQPGGFYSTREGEKKWGIWRLLILDEHVLHCALYMTKFDHAPSLAEAENADLLAMHAPISSDSILTMPELTLLGGKALTHDDLYGLQVYLESMGDSEKDAVDAINAIIERSPKSPVKLKLTRTDNGLRMDSDTHD